MKFTEAWADVAKQNVNYKLITFVLGLCSLVFCYSTLHLSLKPPILIERACETKIIENSKKESSHDEIKQFAEKALLQRFNTANKETYFLSENEKRLKKSEQKAFSKKNIIQNLLIRSVTLDKESIHVEADRIFAVGNVRSNFPITMNLDMKTKKRDRQNPYGLVLNKVIPIKKDANDE